MLLNCQFVFFHTRRFRKQALRSTNCSMRSMTDKMLLRYYHFRPDSAVKVLLRKETVGQQSQLVPVSSPRTWLSCNQISEASMHFVKNQALPTYNFKLLSKLFSGIQLEADSACKQLVINLKESNFRNFCRSVKTFEK